MDEPKQAEEKAEIESQDSSPESEPTEDVNTPEEQSADDSTETPEVQEEQETPKKETRESKRVKQLIEKLKDKDSNDKPQDNVKLPWETDDERLVRPEDYENGIDPVELERRVTAQRQKDRELIKREIQAETSYKSSISEHLSDIEKTQELLGDDPELDKYVARQYERLNNVVDPYTGQTVFVPKVKMSEIYNEFHNIVEKKSTAYAADVSTRLGESSQMGAVKGSATGDTGKNFEEEALFERARQSEKTEDWAAVLKKRLSKS